jgi:hypothetical protein
VDGVFIRDSRDDPRYDLDVVLPDGTQDSVSFPAHVALLDRVRSGATVWVGYPPGRPITAVSDAATPPPDGSAAQTVDSPRSDRGPVYLWLGPASVLFLFICLRLGRPAQPTRRRPGTARWSRWRMPIGYLACAGWAVCALVFVRRSTVDSASLLGAGLVGAAVVVVAALFVATGQGRFRGFDVRRRQPWQETGISG